MISTKLVQQICNLVGALGMGIYVLMHVNPTFYGMKHDDARAQRAQNASETCQLCPQWPKPARHC